ncbi:hypothetical protein S2M10_42090 [Sphingomonas sp. S2M10]|uniref:hypothetical protein n=1 Tax=Sphingomonas sp. S2M10 TaxID=2705010 RepID=UPI0014568912|nr:hypothetical protein [Sphingomonas sp. S2M10]NLS29189.1 hypothetical protein [Sphingomonas sp. S2M10]
MRKRLLLTIPALGLALSGCGVREALAPPPGGSLPVAPYGASATPTPPDLLKPTAQNRPARSDDLIQASEARRSDEFDLPPN